MGSHQNAEFNDLDAIIRLLSEIDNDLTLPLALTLLHIARSPGISVGELAEIMDVPQQTASRYVGTLLGRYQAPGNDNSDFANKSLIDLGISKEDPRRRTLILTPPGDRRLQSFLAIYRSQNDKKTSGGREP